MRSPCTVKARAFKEGLEPSEVASVEFKKVELRKSDAPPDCAPGLTYKYYEGQWEKLPDFDALTPVATGVVETISLAPRKRDDRFGFVFSGYIQVPTDGMYTFWTVSDDGSQLLIGDTLVVDNDGPHGPRARSGKIALAAGKHAFTVRFFEWAGGEELIVYWAGPGFARQTIPAGALFH